MFLIWDDDDDDDDDDDEDDDDDGAGAAGAAGGGGDGDGVIVIMMIKWLVFRGKLKSATRGRVCFFEHIGLLNITRKWQLGKAHYKSYFISAVVVGHHCSHAPCTDLGAPYLMPSWNPMVFCHCWVWEYYIRRAEEDPGGFAHGQDLWLDLRQDNMSRYRKLEDR